MAQGRKGLVAMVRANSAVCDCLMTGVVLHRDSPGNTPNLPGEDVETLGVDAAVTVVQDTLLLLGRTHQAVVAGQIVSDECGWAPVGLGVGRAVGRYRSGVVLCQQRGLNNPVCWQRSATDLGCLQT